MISLFTRDDYAALGLAALLDGEGIAHRRIERLEEHRQGLLVALGTDLSRDESSAIAAQPSLVLNGGVAFARTVLAARRPLLDERAAVLPLAQPLWPARVSGLAAQFEKTALRVPHAPLCRAAGGLRGEVVSTFADAQPAVVRRGACVWSALDLGSAFAHLLTERYLPTREDSRGAGLRAALRGIAERAYYAAPARWREAARRRSYALLERRLQALGERASEYPIDATGWLMGELLRSLIARAAGQVLRIERWPAGFQSAAVMTHDLEPQRYAYTEGVRRLLGAAARGAMPRAFGIVAQPAVRWLRDPERSALAGHEVFCHGLDHRGERVWGRQVVARNLRRARALVGAAVGRSVEGYRSPRLDRSPDLDWALDDAGFTYDSSRPDVDRENLRHYGGGVRGTLPYRPLLDDGGSWRSSRCLELPLTAPDCIQPLFVGQDDGQLYDAVRDKAAFVHASGGMYVALVHAGVFGADDAAQREAHGARLAALLSRPGIWRTTPQGVVEWWTAREQVRIVTRAGGIAVCNSGPRAVAGAVLAIERDGVVQRVALPVLAAGETFAIDHSAADRPEEWQACRHA